MTAGTTNTGTKNWFGPLELEWVLQALTDDGWIAADSVDELLQLFAFGDRDADHRHPLVWIAGRRLKNLKPPHKIISLENLTEWLAACAGLPYLHIDPLKIDMDAVTNVVSQAYAVRYQILPVAVDEDSVTFATAEPWSREWEDELVQVLRRDIKRVVCNPQDIARFLAEMFGVSRSMQKAKDEYHDESFDGIGNLEDLVELGRAGKLDANDRHVVSIVDWLLQYAFDQRASDIHVEPRRESGHIRFRIDGVMHSVYEMPAMVMAAVTSRIKVLGRMDLVEKRRPQDGRVKTRTPSGQEVELRLSTMPTAFGEKLVMRIFDPEVLVRDLTDLGFSPSDASHWREMTAYTHGVILVTGPTGSGKTTTLYSTLKHLATDQVNVCTVEDPIEMVEPAFNQMQVNLKIGLDFATGVKTLMRQDPDIIMVGEIRDADTAAMAVQASLTGHLVLSTLHTNEAAAAITRLTDIGVPHYLMNATLLGVVAQRLVRTLCPHCKKVEGAVDPAAWQALVHPFKMAAPVRAYQPVGCIECRNTGYRGRLGVYEILRVTPELRQLIRSDSSSIEALRQQGFKQGMEPLRISGARKIHAGLTTLEEVLRVAPPSEI
jgi:general secretion pathway protein E